MNYEQKYKEALECIQEILNSGIDTMISMSRLKLRLQPFFPELKESEDEKMRKKCIKYLDWAYQSCVEEYKEEIERCISWLEKQGKQNPVEWSEEDEKIKESIKKVLANTNFNRLDIKYSFYEMISWLEKQNKQSPSNIPSRELILSVWDLGNEWKELTNGSISTEYGTQLEYIQNHWQESSYYDNIMRRGKE